MKIILYVQGERRFFRVCYKWLAEKMPKVARRNFELISEYGRYDDVIYTLIGTPLENDALAFITDQFKLDMESKTPSLLGKWLPSENASAVATKKMASVVRSYMGLTHKEYRKSLSQLRTKINIVEKLMSENRWDEIEFDKIPSKAGLIYKNAFARRDIIAKKYETFAKDTSTKVNAEVLNPVDIAKKILTSYGYGRNALSDTDVAMLQKYWDNLKDYYNGREENGIAVIDTSGSMSGTPIQAAISMGAYIAERGHGPFANHFITFSSCPDLIKFKGINIVDKFRRCANANWNTNTNIKAVFDLLLKTAKKNHTPQSDMPSRVYIFSDMEFDSCTEVRGEGQMNTLLEDIAEKWTIAGYELPQLIFWNLDCRHSNIPAIGGRFAYISGFSMSMIESILSGKDGYDLMLEKLMSDRYAVIQ